MALLNTAQFTLTDMEQKRSLGDRLQGQWITVKDFGAVGDGSHDDTANIQAAFDYAYGAEGDEHGEANSHLNKVVFFPAGIYKVLAPLVLSHVWAPTLIGAGSHQSRIVYEGDEIEVEDAVLLDASMLLVCKTCFHVHMEGLTLDAGGVQMVALASVTHALGGGNGAGHDGYYRDIHFTNTNFAGILSNANSGHAVVGLAMGSERTYVRCRFTNHTWGANLVGDNSLNHNFYGCYFANCLNGVISPVGGQCLFHVCRFHNNSNFDVRIQQNGALFKGCRSTSQNFVCANAIIISSTHENVSEGYLFDDWPGAAGVGISNTSAIFKGNYSSNGKLKAHTSDRYYTLIGNTFDNADYLDDAVSAGATIWEDGDFVP